MCVADAFELRSELRATVERMSVGQPKLLNQCSSEDVIAFCVNFLELFSPVKA